MGRWMTRWMGLMGLLLVVGCAPVTETYHNGNEYVQHAYSRNAWYPNWHRTIVCPTLDASGFCPKEDRRIEERTDTVVPAAGPQLASAGIHAAGLIVMGGLLSHGLQHMNTARMTQSVNTTSNGFGTGYISTLSGYQLPWQSFP